MRCDALTPVWLSVMVAAGALLFALALAQPGERAGCGWRWRSAAGAAIVGRLRLALPAMPRPARAGLARTRSAPGSTMSARRGRSTRTRFRIGLPDRGAAGDRHDRRGDRDVARARQPTASSAGRRSRCSPRSPARCCCGRSAPGRRRRCWRCPARSRWPGSSCPGASATARCWCACSARWSRSWSCRGCSPAIVAQISADRHGRASAVADASTAPSGRCPRMTALRAAQPLSRADDVHPSSIWGRG